MFFAEDYVVHFALQQVGKIIRERWRKIVLTTRYGWLTACYNRTTISPEDAEVLSALARKVGYENCKKTFHRVRAACSNLHPNKVPEVAMAMLDETYTVLMFEKRRRESKSGNTILRDSSPTVFTISSDIFSSAIHNTVS